MSGSLIIVIGRQVVTSLESFNLSQTNDGPAGDLSLSLADPGAAGQGFSSSEAARRRQALRDALELDGRVRVSYDGELLFTGALEHISYQLNNGGSKIALRSRSIAKGLEEAAIPQCSFGADIPIEEAFSTLLAPHGVTIALAAGQISGLALGTFLPRHGERLLPELLRFCRARGLALRELPDGNLELGRSFYGGDVPVLRSGQAPLKNAAVEFDVTRRSSHVKAHGQNRQILGQEPESAARVSDEQSDSGMIRARAVEILAAGLGDIDTTATLADAVRRERLRESMRVRVEVAGWRAQVGMPCWRPGSLVGVDIPEIDVNRTLLIQSVSFQYGQGGRSASLALVPVEGGDIAATGHAAFALPAESAAPASQGGISSRLINPADVLVRSMRI